MNSHQLISKFVAQLCEKQYAYANSTLATIIEAKLKEKIKKESDKLFGKKKTSNKKDDSKKSNKKFDFSKLKKNKSKKK